MKWPTCCKLDKFRPSSVSLENLFKIWPDGVTSKNLIGQATVFLNTLSWRLVEAVKQNYNQVCKIMISMQTPH